MVQGVVVEVEQFFSTVDVESTETGVEVMSEEL